MSFGRVALVLTTLDERIALPLTRRLRATGLAQHVHRVTLSPAQWEALAGGLAGAGRLRRRLAVSLHLFAPSVVAVLGHRSERGDALAAGAADATAAAAATPFDEVARIVRTIRSWRTGAAVLGFWLTDDWRVSRVGRGSLVGRIADIAGVGHAGRAGGAGRAGDVPVAGCAAADQVSVGEEVLA